MRGGWTPAAPRPVTEISFDTPPEIAYDCTTVAGGAVPVGLTALFGAKRLSEKISMVSRKKKRVAVILNKNARRYTGLLEANIARIVPKKQIWATGTIVEAQQAVREILEGGFDMIFCGGGDGTIVTTVSTIRKIQLAGLDFPVPPIGILKMGTGNAWTYAVGVKGGLAQLSRVVNGGYYSISAYPLVQVGDLLCPFAGVGWDAAILNDYYELNRELNGSFISPLMKNLFGYICASAVKTVPRFVRGAEALEVEVTFTGSRLLKPDRKGNYFPITDRTSKVIYHGPAAIVAAGTIPFFGYALRAFPYAGRVPGMMNLRIANLDVSDAIRHIQGFWSGTYFSHKIVDFLADGVRLTFTRDEPIEVGGDPKGYTREIDFTVPDFTVNIVAFWGK